MTSWRGRSPSGEDADDVLDDGWEESTEGDLDPDLTEEAGYLAWDDEAAHRSWLPTLLRVVIVVLLLTLIGSAVLPALL